MTDLLFLCILIFGLMSISVLLFIRLLFIQQYLKKKKLVEDASQQFSFALSKDFKFLHVSDASVNTLDLSASLLINESLKEFVHPDDLELLFKNLEEQIEKSKIKSMFFRARHGSEGWAWVEMYGIMMRWSINSTIIAGYIKNVNDTINSQFELSKLENRLDAILKLNHDIVWEFDVENRELEILTPIVFERHRIPSRIPGKLPLEELISVEDIRLIEGVVNARVEHFVEYGRDVNDPEKLFVRLYGIEAFRVWYSINGFLNRTAEGRLKFFGTGRLVDLAALNKTPPPLKNNLFDSMLSLPFVRVFWVDESFNCLGCNQTFASDLGVIKQETLIGKKLDSFSINTTLSDIIMENLEKVFRTQKDCSGKADFFLGADARPHVAFYSMTSMKNKQKNEPNVVLCVYLIANIDRLSPLELSMDSTTI